MLGIEVGNSNGTMAVARRGALEVISNTAGSRKTPACVAFAEEWLVGDAAQSQAARNPKNTVTDLLLLLGGGEAAQAAGRFDDEVVKLTVRQRKQEVEVATDEHVRAGVTLADLQKLKPVFRREGGSVHAGNSSGITDGQAGVSEQRGALDVHAAAVGTPVVEARESAFEGGPPLLRPGSGRADPTEQAAHAVAIGLRGPGVDSRKGSLAAGAGALDPSASAPWLSRAAAGRPRRCGSPGGRARGSRRGPGRGR